MTTEPAAAGHFDAEAAAEELLLGSASPAVAVAMQATGAAGRVPVVAVDVTTSGPSSLPPPPPKDTAESSSLNSVWSNKLIGEHQ